MKNNISKLAYLLILIVSLLLFGLFSPAFAVDIVVSRDHFKGDNEREDSSPSTRTDMVSEGELNAEKYNFHTMSTSNNSNVFDPNKPLIQCNQVESSFHYCKIVDLSTLSEEEAAGKVGCRKWVNVGNDIPTTTAFCSVLPDIECYGERSWTKTVKCTKYGHYDFVTGLLLSLFLGFVGADRFYLGHIASGVFKLLTLGGLGIWWVLDIILILSGDFGPMDGTMWREWY